MKGGFQLDNKLKINYESYYFSVVPFIKAARDLGCWCVTIVGARKRGKTYSMLEHAYLENEQIVFLKRQVGDIKLLCLNAKNKQKHIAKHPPHFTAEGVFFYIYYITFLTKFQVLYFSDIQV